VTLFSERSERSRSPRHRGAASYDADAGHL